MNRSRQLYPRLLKPGELLPDEKLRKVILEGKEDFL
jgi:hypothetical protein